MGDVVLGYLQWEDEDGNLMGSPSKSPLALLIDKGLGTLKLYIEVIGEDRS